MQQAQRAHLAKRVQTEQLQPSRLVQLLPALLLPSQTAALPPLRFSILYSLKVTKAKRAIPALKAHRVRLALPARLARQGLQAPKVFRAFRANKARLAQKARKAPQAWLVLMANRPIRPP